VPNRAFSRLTVKVTHEGCTAFGIVPHKQSSLIQTIVRNAGIANFSGCKRVLPLLESGTLRGHFAGFLVAN